MKRILGCPANGALVLAALLAAGAPLAARAVGSNQANGQTSFPGWPAQYEGRALTQLPLSVREEAFVRDFPGKVGRFTDGRREIILRWVAAPTRKLHPAADCFRGIGYSIDPLPARRDAGGVTASCFRASKGGTRLLICESVRSAGGVSWPDVSSWYWSALWDGRTAPWWSVVVAKAE